ncbi:MAG: ATP-binding cassette domain-containing protein [Eubacteriales bacterium]|nr:ATP-binding cassette domain-containing protein [Eubacteriales bacterium]
MEEREDIEKANIEWRYLDLKHQSEEIYISRFEESKSGEEAAVNPGEMPVHYATIRCRDGKWEIEDTSTKFGVKINGIKMNENTLLQENDEICIGDTLFYFTGMQLKYSHRQYTENRLSIHIEERSVWTLFKKKTLLEDIDLTIYPGEMVLLLGGSGAGKTTFINAVTGYEKAKATILEGDRDIYRNYNQLKYNIGMVPQQDLLRMDDTVQMTLMNAAEMRMPVHFSAQEREARVKELLEMFGLDAEADELVGKLSGGQRKRLSICVEFVAAPDLFILDEPDSGLDGVMARELMEYLRKIADDRKIVMVITHTPDRVIDLFDKVIVLAKGTEDHVGHLVYYGSVEEAGEFFGIDSMEEILSLINSKDEGGEGLADEYLEKYQKLVGEKEEVCK